MVFFFSSRRRHTRYWRDWSSDVCSSDLTADAFAGVPPGPTGDGRRVIVLGAGVGGLCAAYELRKRSEERGGGEECRSRWSPYQLKKKNVAEIPVAGTAMWR